MRWESLYSGAKFCNKAWFFPILFCLKVKRNFFLTSFIQLDILIIKLNLWFCTGPIHQEINLTMFVNLLKYTSSMSSMSIFYVMLTFYLIFWPANTKIVQLNTENIPSQIRMEMFLNQWMLCTLRTADKENIGYLLEHFSQHSKCNSWRKGCKSCRRNFPQMFHSCLEKNRKVDMSIYTLHWICEEQEN